MRTLVTDRQRRDFVHVHDVGAANVKAAETDRGGFRACNIASGTFTTVGAVAAAVHGPPPVITGRFRAGDVRHVVATPDRASTELSFEAKIGLAEGMRSFAAAPLRT